MLALSTICVTMSAEDHAQTAGPCSMSGGDAVTTDTRIDPATIEARCRRLMAEHAATERRGWDSERARDDLRAEIDAWLDEWLAAVGASCFDEVAS
jgi:hypothetical protein